MEAHFMAPLVGAALAAIRLVGAACAVHALMSARTAQGTVAWILALLLLPEVSLALYLLFGRSKFHGYARARRLSDEDAQRNIGEISVTAKPLVADLAAREEWAACLERLADLPFLKGNALALLADGERAFQDMLAAIGRAKSYILVQFYIIRDDGLGNRLAEALAAKAAEGVRIYFLFDEIGCFHLPERYAYNLRAAGVRFEPFGTTRGPRNRFQINFRNHRKILVVDGQEGWVGGHNVGDEYLGKSRRFGPWRDTHVRIEGPAVDALQVSFFEDWLWATGERLQLAWDFAPSKTGDIPVLVIPSGPGDERETASLMFQQCIAAARQRLWIASPYFVPDHGLVDGLILAKLRGVDVRVLLPDRPDHLLVWLASFAYADELLDHGITVMRYLPGFMHQKVFLADNRIAGVGTANFDNRSFRLNFEVTAIAADVGFCAEIAAMLENDFANSRAMHPDELEAMPFWRMAACRAARLLSPIL